MNKKVFILVRSGLPCRETIMYGCERARELGAKPVLIGVVPRLGMSRRVALAACEMAPYGIIANNLTAEAVAHLERSVRFCLDNGISADHRLETGGIDGVIEKVLEDRGVKLVVVPATEKKEHHHAEFVDAIKKFAQDMLGKELPCPVVSVLTA